MFSHPSGKLECQFEHVETEGQSNFRINLILNPKTDDPFPLTYSVHPSGNFGIIMWPSEARLSWRMEKYAFSSKSYQLKLGKYGSDEDDEWYWLQALALPEPTLVIANCHMQSRVKVVFDPEGLAVSCQLLDLDPEPLSIRSELKVPKRPG